MCKVDINNSRFNRTPYLWIIAALFLVWSGVFIFRTSFVGIDGVRHFCLFDDAMISMRYGWNLSHGLGLVWNAGERVEGFTNLLMTLYMSLATLLFSKDGAVLFIQVSGIAFMLGIAYITMRIAGEIFHNRTPGTRNFLMVLSFAAALSYYPLAYFSLMGMETGLLAVLLLSAIWIAIRCNGKSKIMPLLPILMGLAFLTRPDALVPIALIWIYRLVGVLKKEKWIRIMLIETAILGIFIVGATLFRWFYYGDIVPNTYTLKLGGMPLMFRIKQGIPFIWPFLWQMKIPIFLALLNIVLNFRKNKFLLIILFIFSVAYQVYLGGDPWPYWRMMAPFVPLLFILCIEEVWDILDLVLMGVIAKYISRNPVLRPPLLEKTAVAIMVFCLLLSANLVFKGEIIGTKSPYTANDNHTNVDSAIALTELTTHDATVGVFWGGSIPYYTGLKSIDFLGKSDQYIAHLPPDLSGIIAYHGMKSVPGHNKYDLNYSIVTLRPTYVQGFTRGRDDVSAFGQLNYVEVEYKGVKLWLLKDSTDVLWDKIPLNR